MCVPDHDDLRSINWCEPTSFSYLYQLESINTRPNLSIYSAKTEEIEIKHILSQIKERKVHFDCCVIFYTKLEPYLTTLFQLSEQKQIPVTYGDGLPRSFSRPGRLVHSILEWMNEQYSVRAFLHLLQEGLFVLPDQAPSIVRISTLLREADIGWNPARYQQQLNQLVRKYEYKISSTSKLQRRKDWEGKWRDLLWLKDWFIELFRKLPAIDSIIHEKEMLKSIYFIVENYATTISTIDQSAKETILNHLDKLTPYAVEALNRYDMFEKVSDLLNSIRIHKSAPKPGHLHIDSYQRGTYYNRSHVFIVGADNQSFPGMPSEDPLLLDEERQNLNSNLKRMKEKGEENQYTMLQLLALTDGPVSISYCSFNVHENRPVQPSYLFLQCYRAVTENTLADFKELKNLSSPSIPEDTFDDKDYWLSFLNQQEGYRLEDQVKHEYRNVMYGSQADKARRMEQFTEYDGRVNIDVSEYDPRRNPNRTLTAGKLEKLASCSYAYFLEEILQVKPVEEYTYDSFAWLDAPTRGTLLHSIFETFYQRLYKNRQKPSFLLHQQELHTLAHQLIDEQKVVQPPPNERVFQRETEDIIQACDIFLKEEEEFSQTNDALYFEYSFGVGEAEPAEIKLPSNEKILISGKIDRVDQSTDGSFHIIDYKTGSTYNYKDYESFKGGRQLQHFIYALAIEQHLKLEQGAVKESSYFFPTSEGKGRRFSRKQDAALRKNGLDILEKLIDVIKSGQFSMTDNPNDCHFCQLNSVCRRSFYDADTLEAKQMDPAQEGVRKFKGVRNYD
ncbi:PD-(D/E)XK nuclease family protein [Salinibacillus kushneri]|uniref:PD-(D/E)XK nuclease family protein n=1 Tax=Salinibacillus kushneri TaxID=237682 RepID=UPI00115FCA98|nr:PD-(D/E)XK nuclease family protein [Salinibacillus kushneri]